MRRLIPMLAAVLAVSSLAFPQGQSYGRLEGVVKDAQGLVLPGVTITLTGEALMGERVVTSDVDGSYRFPNLSPGTYTCVFEMAGFQTFNREGIVIPSGRTISIDVMLQLATVAETVTVTGESPVVDVKTTGVSATFDETALKEVPSATDMWAVLQVSPGIRMRGYDVGGSHKSQQSSYESFGVRAQNRVVNEGVNTTEGAGWSGGYYDYYAIQEFQVSAQGADVEMSSPGAHVVAIWKSGSNNFSSLTHLDYEASGMVADNIDDALRARNGSSAPVRSFKEFHTDLGGPVARDKFWFYGAFNYFKIDKIISGRDPSIATDVGIFHEYTGKINWQMTEKDQFIGFSHWSLKNKPFRGLSLTVPAESIRAQYSWTWLHKAEWQRVWSDRLFSNVLIGHFGFGWPMVPAVDPATKPPRLDLATGIRAGAGWQPFTMDRWKPQSTGQFNYYVPQAAGSHDFKFGWDWQIDSFQFSLNTNSGAVRYRDNSNLGLCSPCATGQVGVVDEIQFYNVPTLNDDRNQHTNVYAQDIWTVNDRLTLTLGARFERQNTYYLSSSQTPVLGDFFPPVSIPAGDVIAWNTLAPRMGATIDLTGEGKSVLKAYYGRYYSNAATVSPANPGGGSSLRYKFLDPNGNGVYDGKDELGELVASFGGGGGTQVDPDIKIAYTDEFSFSFEHELIADTSVRFSFVRKQLRNNWYSAGTPWTVNLARSTDKLTQDVTATCDGCPGRFDGSTLNLRTLPDGVPTIDNWVANAPGNTDTNFDTIQFAFTKRYSNNFFFNGNFDYQWRHEMRGAGASGSPLTTDPIGVFWYPEYNRNVSLMQDSTNWGAKGAFRYTAPHDIGIAGSIRYQSGFPWAAIHRAGLPNVGTVAFFLEDIKNNRSEDVTIVDLRLDKAFVLNDRYRVTALLDVYNALNANPETNFIMRTGGSYRDIIEWLAGRTFKIGVRFQF